MATKQLNFTKATLQQLPPAQGSRDYYRDIKENKLCLSVTRNGIKTFFVRKKIGGKDERIHLGNFPDLSIENARQLCAKAKNDIALGINPQAARRAIQSEMTLKELFEKYLEEYCKVHKRSWKYDEREIPKFLSHWFSRKISSITQHEVRKLHEQIRNESGLYQANRLLERLRGMYNRAIEWGWKGENPAIGIRKFKEKARDRFLQPYELPYFFEALEIETNSTAKDYILLSLLTGARKSNMLSMRWREVDMEQASWRIPETKNGEAVLVPLSPEALKILEGRKKIKSGEWVFPSEESKSGYFQDPKKSWHRVLKRAEIYQLIDMLAVEEHWKTGRANEAKLDSEKNLSQHLAEYRKKAKELKLDTSKLGLPDMRIHDLRRSLGSWQAVTGASLPVIGKSLGHKSIQSTNIYSRLNLDPVRESIDRATSAMLAAGKVSKSS